MTTAKRSIATLTIAIVFSFLGLLCPDGAQAQCPTYTFTNNTTCTVDLTLYDITGATTTYFGMPPGVSFRTRTPGFNALGIVTAKGNNSPNPIPPDLCHDCVTLHVTGGAPTDWCCVEVCYTPPCGITFNPVSCGPGCL